MKKIISLLFPIAIMLVLIVAGCTSSSVIQINTPVPGVQAGAPTPNGQITVPGVSTQVYTPGPNPTVNTTDAHDRIAGIWLGVWHGFISPVTLVISFFKKDVQMYEVHNNGNLYNLGFFLGVAIVFVILGLLFSSRR